MSRLKSLFASLAVTIMITDLVLVALACVPEGQPVMASVNGDQVASVASSSDVGTILAGGGGGNFVQPAFWGRIWRAIKRIGACAGCGLTGYDPWCRHCRGSSGGAEN